MEKHSKRKAAMLAAFTLALAATNPTNAATTTNTNVKDQVALVREHLSKTSDDNSKHFTLNELGAVTSDYSMWKLTIFSEKQQ